MRLQRCAVANRLEGGELRFYPYVVYYGDQRSGKPKVRFIVDRAKTHTALTYPYITTHVVSVAYVPESGGQGYRP